MPAAPVPAPPPSPVTHGDPAALALAGKRCKAELMKLGWKMPTLFHAIARVTVVADWATPTASIDLAGNLRIGPAFAAQHADEELQFILAHELMHLLMLHHDRRGTRDPLKWNIAGDKIINRTLASVAKVLGPGSLRVPASALMATEAQADWTAEQLYSAEGEPDEQTKRDHAAGTLKPGQGCGPQPAPAGEQPDPSDPTGAAPAPSEEQLRREWHEVAVQTLHRAKEPGDRAGNILAGALELPQPKVRWGAVLRGSIARAIAEAGRDDVSWSRRSRRSPPDILLPGGITQSCRAAVVIDTSGSVSDVDLTAAVTETIAIVNHTRVPVFFVAHDHKVQAAFWIRPGTSTRMADTIRKGLIGRGGTSFVEAYNRVEQEGRFNVLVHLTDGEIHQWPACPARTRRLVVALLGNREIPTNLPANARCIEVEI